MNTYKIHHLNRIGEKYTTQAINEVEAKQNIMKDMFIPKNQESQLIIDSIDNVITLVKGNKMEYIIKQESFNSGGGCYVDALTLSNNQVLIINDECIGLYDSIDDFLNDDGNKCLFSMYLK